MQAIGARLRRLAVAGSPPNDGLGRSARAARWPLVLGVVWLAAVAAGLWSLSGYEHSPGVAASPPQRWPSASRIPRDPGRATLVVLAHPRCPCTRATIGELAILMARAKDLASAYVLFGAPHDRSAEWLETDLWDAAAAIPGVAVVEDFEGREARHFGAATSGQTLLYDAGGTLLFSGGITDSRGHSGDNMGRATVLSLLTTGTAETAESPVFGCPLVVDGSSGDEAAACLP